MTAQIWAPEADGPVVILAHGAGSRLDHPVHQGICAAVAARGHTVVSFNFCYAEARRRGPDPASRLLRCWADVAAWVAERFEDRAQILGGRSMGGRIASLLAADGAQCAGLVLLNYPLLGVSRRPGTTPRTDHWPRLRVPVLFVHGDRDRLFDDDVFAEHRPLLRIDAAVHVVRDADHGFNVPKRAGRTSPEVYDEVAGAISRWLSTTVEP